MRNTYALETLNGLSANIMERVCREFANIKNTFCSQRSTNAQKIACSVIVKTFSERLTNAPCFKLPLLTNTSADFKPLKTLVTVSNFSQTLVTISNFLQTLVTISDILQTLATIYFAHKVIRPALIIEQLHRI